MSDRPLIFPMPGNEALADALARTLAWQRGKLAVHEFPDGESLIRVEPTVSGRETLLVCTLHRPNSKALPLMLAADTLKDLGAKRVGLVAPYLAYMRQDRRFREGEGISSRYFARLLSSGFDWLLTVDPHLHRYASLSEVYSIPTRAVHAAPAVAAWIAGNVSNPVLVGPDSESAQWVADVARRAGAPFTVLEKVRRGDRDVEVSIPDVDRWRSATPVLVDDIVSTARTMIATVKHLKQAGLAPPVGVGVHAVFADRAYEELQASGVAAVVTTNTIPHPSNAIDLAHPLADALRGLFA